MEHSIGVGLIVGAVFASGVYVWKSKDFTIEQKILLFICIIFPPLHWVLILLVLAYNKYRAKNTPKSKLNSYIDNLGNLKEKGILTEDEYKEKVENIEAQKTEQDLINSVEYEQLKSLFDSSILTKEEFENKINFLKSKTKEAGISKTATDLQLSNGRILKIFNESNKSFIGASVKFENNSEILTGNFISNKKLYIIQNNIIEDILKGYDVVLKNKNVVTIFKQYPSVIVLRDIVYMNNEKIKDGKYKIGLIKNFVTLDGRVAKTSYFLNLF